MNIYTPTYMKLVDRSEQDGIDQVQLTADYIKWLLNDKEVLKAMIEGVYAELNSVQ